MAAVLKRPRTEDPTDNFTFHQDQKRLKSDHVSLMESIQTLSAVLHSQMVDMGKSMEFLATRLGRLEQRMKHVEAKQSWGKDVSYIR